MRMTECGKQESGAIFSRNMKYRSWLWRVWDQRKPRCNFICLNPSIADTKKNDHSVTKMIGFAERLGCGRLDVTNLFDIITTYPSDLYAWFNNHELSSKKNTKQILKAAMGAKFVICAWGIHGTLCNRGNIVLCMLLSHGIKPKALRLNTDGTPAHPLMLPYSLRPIRYEE